MVPVAYFPHERKEVIEKPSFPKKKLIYIHLNTVNRPKLWWNCAFPQSFHNRKSGEIGVFYPVKATVDENFISHFNLYREQVYFLI